MQQLELGDQILLSKKAILMINFVLNWRKNVVNQLENLVYRVNIDSRLLMDMLPIYWPSLLNLHEHLELYGYIYCYI